MGTCARIVILHKLNGKVEPVINARALFDGYPEGYGKDLWRFFNEADPRVLRDPWLLPLEMLKATKVSFVNSMFELPCSLSDEERLQRILDYCEEMRCDDYLYLLHADIEENVPVPDSVFLGCRVAYTISVYSLGWREGKFAADRLYSGTVSGMRELCGVGRYD